MERIQDLKSKLSGLEEKVALFKEEEKVKPGGVFWSAIYNKLYLICRIGHDTYTTINLASIEKKTNNYSMYNPFIGEPSYWSGMSNLTNISNLVDHQDICLGNFGDLPQIIEQLNNGVKPKNFRQRQLEDFERARKYLKDELALLDKIKPGAVFETKFPSGDCIIYMIVQFSDYLYGKMILLKNGKSNSLCNQKQFFEHRVTKEGLPTLVKESDQYLGFHQECFLNIKALEKTIKDTL